ncbi:helix-turn-helix transcriptional regulator [Streptomyces sp. JV176]|uniref:helix-turn-helix domain-containing protein n=1 Tax=Streptomyces sp. JV176 TaxID=858630 RepID=UPI002E763264|nr:helix-turn-helix transcriptional regulator [Streptomyces sp. JV176]MEE1803906.1 helix-turn-helix transcriptional regulator [Streptomyces sp. JV176]
MDGFGTRAREALAAQGISMRAAARELHYDVAYLSRVLNGKQQPSPQLAQGLDELLKTGGNFAALVKKTEPGANDATRARSAISHLLDHDNRYGGDQVASAAVQVWKAEQRRLDRNIDPDKDHLAAVSEVAEAAGWILFDANRKSEARQAFIESQMLARHAGDRPMQWFAMDLLAMQDVQDGRPGEALRIADSLLATPKLPHRIALIARVRRSRALAQAGDRARSLAEVERAKSALQDSITVRDPDWTWWVDEKEVVGHHGEVLISLGESAAAIPHLQRANELVAPGGRGAFYYAVAELSAFAEVGAWRECETTLMRLVTILEVVTSARSQARLDATLRIIERDAPSWLVGIVRDIF